MILKFFGGDVIISMNKKFDMIDRVKSYRAILNNSFRLIQKLKTKIPSDNFNNLYLTILTIDKNPELNIKNELNNINRLLPLYKKRYDKYFLMHAKKILEYHIKFVQIKSELYKLNINSKLYKFHSIYQEYSQNTIKNAQVAISILFILLVISIILYLIFEYKLRLSNRQLSRFKQTVENSDNIVVITDDQENIKYVNEAFSKTTGYMAEEVIGKKPNILKSGKQSINFYSDLHKTIHSGKKWSGEFINLNKKGELSYEKASITPVIEDGKIIEFIAIKLDITNETVAGQQIKEQEKLLVQQSKMAAMGEMLENIAHQWRQPLSMISTSATGMQMQKELDILMTKDEEVKVLSQINNTAQYLSKTIDDFRDFFKPNKEFTTFNIKDVYKKTFNLVSSKFKSLDIVMIENLNDIKIYNLEGEVIQVIMNILNNARDALEFKDKKEKLIFIDIYKKNNNAIIKIKDNAGGIPHNIIDKVFEPYFTTKHKAQGTGIGLYMSLEMTTKHLNGSLEVANKNYTYKSHNYTGALFTIKLPLK